MKLHSQCPKIQCLQIYRYKQEVLQNHPEKGKEKKKISGCLLPDRTNFIYLFLKEIQNMQSPATIRSDIAFVSGTLLLLFGNLKFTALLH